MPEVIVIDEISTEAEALAARTIAQRGVQLIATAHGALSLRLLATLGRLLLMLLKLLHAVKVCGLHCFRRRSGEFPAVREPGHPGRAEPSPCGRWGAACSEVLVPCACRQLSGERDEEPGAAGPAGRHPVGHAW